MQEQIEAIRAAVAADATDEQKSQGAAACRAILVALGAEPGKPIAMPGAPTPHPLAGIDPDLALDLLIAKLTAALPREDDKASAPAAAPDPRGLRIAFVNGFGRNWMANLKAFPILTLRVCVYGGGHVAVGLQDFCEGDGGVGELQTVVADAVNDGMQRGHDGGQRRPGGIALHVRVFENDAFARDAGKPVLDMSGARYEIQPAIVVSSGSWNV